MPGVGPAYGALVAVWAPAGETPAGATTAASMARAASSLRMAQDFDTGCPIPTSGVLADVLVPQVGVRADELSHQLHARLIVSDDHLDAAGAQQVLGAHERAVLAYDHPRDAVEQHGARAHVTRGQRGVHRRGAIDARGQSAGV